jgi:hypothetical protein
MAIKCEMKVAYECKCLAGSGMAEVFRLFHGGVGRIDRLFSAMTAQFCFSHNSESPTSTPILRLLTNGSLGFDFALDYLRVIAFLDDSVTLTTDAR